jgi:menaquinone-dependent protoporphyrinogen oxidase
MRILITWASKRGGTEGIARMVGEALQQEGHQVDLLPPVEAARAHDFDAVVVGGALYANRWHRAARRFVARREKDLRSVPVWFFSSGPLDDSADRQDIPPTTQVAILMERVGAQGHKTFGGRLLPDARGFPASAMAKKHAGDWRRPDQIRAWASEIARTLTTARPGVVVAQPGRSLTRLLLHGFVGWALCGLTMATLLRATTLGTALTIHALAVPIIFTVVARHYFRARGARDSLAVAFSFVGIVAVLDSLVVAGLIQRSLVIFNSVVGFWVPLALIFGVTWATGEVLSMAPAEKAAPQQAQAPTA